MKAWLLLKVSNLESPDPSYLLAFLPPNVGV
jgi:hypothetical protein